MASVNLTRALSTVYLVHPDDLPGSDDGLEQDALISKTDVKEVIDANGQVWFLLENTGVEDVLNGQKVPLGMVKKDDVEQVSVYNWAAFGFKTKDIASDQFIFQEDNNPLFKAICEELNGDTKDKHAPKPDVPGISRLMHDIANHLKLSRWVYKHASEWGGEADYKKQVKDFLENGAQDSEDAKEMARRKYDRLEAKIANLSWWPEVSSKVKGFPSSAVVHHFNPAAFLEQMRRVEGFVDIDLSPFMVFENQKGGSDCNVTCKRIMKQMGVVPEGATIKAKAFPKKENGKSRFESFFQLADENEGRSDLVWREQSKLKEAIDYLNRALMYGHPVLVGVNHTFAYRSESDYINETTTDHYVIIVGRKFVEGVQRYIFWDVGTSRGSSKEWYFELRGDFKLFAGETYKGNFVTQIRRNINGNNKTINY